jgi:hypothetical protein
MSLQIPRRLIMLTLVVVATLGTALNYPREVHATSLQDHHHGCSVASLKGTYAFVRTGINNVLGGPIAQIGFAVLDGNGNIQLIRTTRSNNGVIEDWTNETAPGNYTVDPDCTGTFFNGMNNIVVFDGGKRFFLLSAGAGTTTTEEGTRLDTEN